MNNNQNKCINNTNNMSAKKVNTKIISKTTNTKKDNIKTTNIKKDDNIYDILNIVNSCYQTKKWRMSQNWYINGKHNECEKYQIGVAELLLGQKINKTYERINMSTKELVKMVHPLKNNNGFDYTENFDGKIISGDKKIYFNFKFVCDNGGAQNRSLREVYHFIKYQYKMMRKNNSSDIYVMNILDGNTSNMFMDKFKYLSTIEENIELNKYIFIGDLKTFSIQKNQLY